MTLVLVDDPFDQVIRPWHSVLGALRRHLRDAWLASTVSKVVDGRGGVAHGSPDVLDLVVAKPMCTDQTLFVTGQPSSFLECRDFIRPFNDP